MHIRIRLIVLASLLALAGAAAQSQSPSGLLVRNGRVVDGTAAPARPADVRIEGDTIVAIGTGLEPRAGERVRGARGLVVSPGFIDMHSHAGDGIDDAPDSASQVRQGVTTALVGQDGGGELPVASFFDGIDRTRPTINFAASVGHGTVRHIVMGADYKRAATTAEIATMQVLVERGMRDGAVGLASGLEYDPGFYATVDELVALAAVAGRFGGFYSSHVRDEEND